MPSNWSCPKPAAQYKLEHEITEQDFNDREPVYLTSHDAAYIAENVDGITDCELPVGLNPAGEIVLEAAPDLVYYPAGLFKALLDADTEIFEMYGADTLGQPDVIMKTIDKDGNASFYDMTQTMKW